MQRDILYACDCNFLHANAIFMGSSRHGEVLESHDLHISHSGLPTQDFNRLFLKQPVDDVLRVVATAEAYFGQRQLPFVVNWGCAMPATVAEQLSAAGYTQLAAHPVMVLTELPAQPPHVAGLTIEVVKTDEELAAFGVTTMAGFGFPKRSGALFITPQMRDYPGVELYLGYVDGIPVCTSMLVMTGHVAGIYWVATIPEYRKRGLAEAITWAAVAGGKQRGCSVANLQASRMGEPVYRRMGFATPCHYPSFAKVA